MIDCGLLNLNLHLTRVVQTVEAREMYIHIMNSIKIVYISLQPIKYHFFILPIIQSVLLDHVN